MVRLFCQDCGHESYEFGLFTIPEKICPQCKSTNLKSEPNIFLEVNNYSVTPHLCQKCKVVFYIRKKDEPLLQFNPAPYPFCPFCGRLASSQEFSINGEEVS